MVLFQNCVRQSRFPTKMATTVQLRCYWKQLWSRWAITGSWEPLVVHMAFNYRRTISGLQPLVLYCIRRGFILWGWTHAFIILHNLDSGFRIQNKKLSKSYTACRLECKIFRCNRCLSPQKLWVRILLMMRWIRCNIMWYTTGRWFSPGSTISFTNKTDRWNIVKSGVKHHNPHPIQVVWNLHTTEFSIYIFTHSTSKIWLDY